MTKRWTPEAFAEAIGGRLIELDGGQTVADAYYAQRGEAKLSPEEIKEIRGRFSVAEAARIAGVTASAWHNWESGQRGPRPTSIAKILKVRDSLPIEQRIVRLEEVVLELVNELKGLKAAVASKD